MMLPPPPRRAADESANVVVGDVLAECVPACLLVLAKSAVDGETATEAVAARKTTLGFSGAGR